MSAIEVQNCDIYYDRKILNDISFHIDEFQHTAIIGPNGSGKSTLINMLTKNIYPSRLNAKEPILKILNQDNWNIFELRKKMSLISNKFEHTLLNSSPLTVIDAVASSFLGTYGFFADDKITTNQLSKTEKALKDFDIYHLKNTQISELSTGQLKRVMVARAMVLSPRIMLLDEPSSGLDISAQHELFKHIRSISTKLTLIMVTHHLEEIIPEIQKIIMIKDGCIFKIGEKKKVLTAENLSQLFDTNIALNIQNNDQYSMHRI
jgi:iron complex transport system ATP-binding protein